MARSGTSRSRSRPKADELFEPADSTLLDALDNLLTRGVLLDGDVTLGLAGVDLVYIRLSALLAAADRVLPELASGSRVIVPARRRARRLRKGRSR